MMITPSRKPLSVQLGTPYGELSQAGRETAEAMQSILEDSGPPSIFYEDPVLKQLDALLELSEDWDLEGAKQIMPELIQSAKHFYSFVTSDFHAKMNAHLGPDVWPSGNGGLQLVWSGINRKIVVFFEPGQAELEVAIKEAGMPARMDLLTAQQAKSIVLDTYCPTMA